MYRNTKVAHTHTFRDFFFLVCVQLPLDSLHLPGPVDPPPPLKLCQSHVKVTLQPSEPVAAEGRKEQMRKEKEEREREKT